MGYTHAIGRRKTAIVRLYMRAALTNEATFQVNRRPWKEYFPSEIYQLEILKPFEAVGARVNQYDIVVYAEGGGIKGQAEALRLAIARALVRMREENHAFLRKAGLLTVDARKVERKHYGHKKARKSFQFSKR
ncbi:MAG: 30S ribosomal protein S9 [Bacteroidia bacterium]|nr:30S ribosomal protein S9 [Bacteroidia bacterium]MDW8236209.1 30S ribosomal protein S9 [Bacteroidia bacterium]